MRTQHKSHSKNRSLNMSLASTIFLCILLIHRASRVESISGWVEPANPNEFPFVVSIARKFDVPWNNPYGHTCGGALLTRKYVLTSANCFSENKKSSDYLVYAGSSDLEFAQKIEIASWTTHECWITTGKLCRGYRFSDNDIAIVTLNEKVKSPAIPAKISNISPTDLEGQNVTTAGWGLLFDDTIPRNMLKADLRVITISECMANVWRATDGLVLANYEHNIFCTNGVTLFAVLDGGDRGSPVFINEGNGIYRIVGVNQKSVPSVNEVVQVPDQQNKHIGIHHYLKFIKSVTRLTYIQL